MKKPIIALIFVIILMGMVQAIDHDKIFRQGQAGDLTFTCIDEATGINCDSGFNCTVTIQYPNTTILANNENATKIGNLYNYTLPNTDTLGLYQYQTSCTNSTDGGTSAEKYFLINVLGEEIDTSKALIYFGGLALLIVFFLMSLSGAILIPFDNKRNEEGVIVGMNDLKYVKILLWFISYLFLVSIAFMAKTVTGFLEAGVATGIFNFSFWFLVAFFFPVFVIFMVGMVVKFLEDQKIHQLSLRNIKIR